MENQEYDRIVHLYLDSIYRVALNSCKNPQDAEDIVQNTFLKLLNHTEKFKNDEHVRKWLIRVAINESNSMWRSFWKRNVTSLEENTEEPVFSTSEHSELFFAIRKLPQKYREIVHLYYYEEYSIREISEILHISETNIQTRLMRARNKLKQLLKEAWK